MAGELISAGVKVEEVARRLGKHEVTIYRWEKGIRYRGLRRFVKERKEAKRKVRRRILDTEVVLKIKKIKEETDWCGEKIVWRLKTEHGIRVPKRLFIDF